MAIYIGCGSWADDEYQGILYPKGLPRNERLATYAKTFGFVEVNSTYYATPKAETVKAWVKQTPPGFRFDIKMHRAFSQSPGKVAENGDFLERIVASVQPLVRAKKFGTFLLVLAPSFTPEKHSLAELLPVVERLRPLSLAVELRHIDWVKGKNRATTLRFFRDHQIAWVAVDMPRIESSRLMPPIDEVTHLDLAYLRLHGRNPNYLNAKTAAEGHTYEYTARELAGLVERIITLSKSAKEVHVVANNHAQDFAPKTALALKKLLLRQG